MIPDTIQWYRTLASVEFGIWFTPFNWKLNAAAETGCFTGHAFVQIGPVTLAANYCVSRK